MIDPQFNDLTSEPDRLAYIHDDMQSQVYGDNREIVGMNECNAEYFATWYRWRMQNFPVEHITKSGDKLLLSEFDIESAVELMAEWIRQPFNLDFKPTTDPQ